MNLIGDDQAELKEGLETLAVQPKLKLDRNRDQGLHLGQDADQASGLKLDRNRDLGLNLGRDQDLDQGLHLGQDADQASSLKLDRDLSRHVESDLDVDGEKDAHARREAYKLDAYRRVAASRAKGRATGKDFISNLISDFVEFHGDRRYGDDPAVITGIGKLKNMPVTVIAMEKGHTTKEKVHCNFGSMHPEGYRKALRQMKLAEKFGRPVFCIVDTSGAHCGIEAEERGQGQAIAENLMEMMTLATPIITLFIGEGGSGGALGLAVADQVWMLENSFYSVISPEGCASILWKDASKMKEAAESLKLTARDLYLLGVAERVIREPELEKDFRKVYYLLEDLLYSEFEKNKKLPVEELLENRYQKFRRIGAK